MLKKLLFLEKILLFFKLNKVIIFIDKFKYAQINKFTLNTINKEISFK